MRIESLRKNEDVLCCFRRINIKGCRLLWEITSKCNLKCLHCFVKPTKNKKELTTKEALEIIDLLPKINVKKILFTGGEPLLRKDIFELIKKSIDKGIHVDLNTNATLIDYNIAEKLQKAKLQEITTSIDGANAKTHEKIRGVKGSFKKTIENIRILKKMKFRVDIVCVANKINKNEIENVIDLAFSLGADSITISNLIIKGNALKNLERLKLTSSDFSKIKKVIDKKREELSNFPIRTLGMPWGLPEKCEAGKGILYLDSTGELHPCSLMCDMKHHSAKFKKIEKFLLDAYYFKNLEVQEKNCPLQILTLS